MAKLTVKLLNGEEFDIFDIALEQLTPAMFIQELISEGALPPNDQLPKTSHGHHTGYFIIDKNNIKVSVENYSKNEITVSNIDLDNYSPHNLLNDLIENQILRPEEELPMRECIQKHGYYGVLDKVGVKLNTQTKPCSNSLSSLGFEDGDVIRIGVVACCASNFNT